MIIRPAKLDDIEAVCELVKYLVTSAPVLQEYVEIDEDSIMVSMYDRIAEHRMLIAEVNGEVAGCATWYITYPYWNLHHRCAFTEFIVVDPEYQSEGVGRTLHQQRLNKITELGAKFVISDQVRDARTGEMYASMGYTHFQNNFIKALG